MFTHRDAVRSPKEVGLSSRFAGMVLLHFGFEGPSRSDPRDPDAWDPDVWIRSFNQEGQIFNPRELSPSREEFRATLARCLEEFELPNSKSPSPWIHPAVAAAMGWRESWKPDLQPTHVL